MTNEEMKLQAACYQWYWNKYRFTPFSRMLHCNNNNSHNKIEGNKNKALGVVAGVADMELLYSLGKVLFIELKVGDNKQSAEQKEFMTQAMTLGHFYTIIKTLKDFQGIVMGALGE